MNTITTDLTDLQAQALRVVEELTAACGYPPTIREIAEACGVNASTAYARLLRLRARGRIDWEQGKPRTIVLIPDGRQADALDHD